jgi:BON domain-containing protein
MRGRTTPSIWAFALMLASLAPGCSRLGLGRSDQQVADEVRGKISADANIPGSKEITVEANNGVVTLSGGVGSETERGAAAADASQVQGVKSVINNLEVTRGAAPVAGGTTGVAPARPARTAREAAPATSAAAVTVPEGTPISIRMIDLIDSERNKPGDVFRASLEAPIVVGDTQVVAKGANVEGRVAEAKSAGHFKGRSEIALELTRLTVGGRSYALQTNQWSHEGASRGKRTAETVGGGAAVGAIIGGVAGGGKGAAIGAGAGAGAGTAVQAITKGQQVRIPSETVVQFQLTAPLRVSRARR